MNVEERSIMKPKQTYKLLSIKTIMSPISVFVPIIQYRIGKTR